MWDHRATSPQLGWWIVRGTLPGMTIGCMKGGAPPAAACVAACWFCCMRLFWFDIGFRFDIDGKLIPKSHLCLTQSIQRLIKYCGVMNKCTWLRIIHLILIGKLHPLAKTNVDGSLSLTLRQGSTDRKVVTDQGKMGRCRFFSHFQNTGPDNQDKISGLSFSGFLMK